MRVFVKRGRKKRGGGKIEIFQPSPVGKANQKISRRNANSIIMP